MRDLLRFKDPAFGHWEVVSSLLIWVLALILVVHPTGDYPLNDDWAYAKDVSTLLTEGQYRVVGFEAAWGTIQVFAGFLLGKVFGFSHFLLRLLSLVGAAGAAIGLNQLLKQLDIKSPLRFVALLAFLFYPPFFIVSNSFNTDTIAACLTIWGLVLYARAWQGQSKSILVVASVVAAMGIAQRQTGIMAPASAGLFWLTQNPFGRDQRVSGFTWIYGVSCMFQLLVLWGLSVWRSTIPGAISWPVGRSTWDTFTSNAFTEMMYLGLVGALFCFPFKLLKPSGIRNLVRWLLASALFVSAIVTALIRARSGELMPYLGNLLSEFGVFRINEVLLGTRQAALGYRGQVLLTAICILGILFLTAKLFLKPHGKWPLPLLLVSIYGVVCSVASVTATQVVFDRYFIPLVPVVIVWAVWQAPEKQWLFTFLALIPVIYFSTTVLENYFRWNDRRWEAGRWAVAQGVSPANIEGGYEWDGWYRNSTFPADTAKETLKGASWLQSFEASKNEVVVSFAPLDGYEVWKQYEYPLLWEKRSQPVYVLRKLRDRISHGQ